MVRIAITGMSVDKIAQLAREVGGDRVETLAKTDLEAALAVKNGQADYYIGACQSGAGAALGVATAVLGSKNVTRVSGQGSVPDPEHIRSWVREGKTAFGVGNMHLESVIPVLVSAILETRADS
jgi:hypothetical protein